MLEVLWQTQASHCEAATRGRMRISANCQVSSCHVPLAVPTLIVSFGVQAPHGHRRQDLETYRSEFLPRWSHGLLDRYVVSEEATPSF